MSQHKIKVQTFESLGVPQPEERNPGNPRSKNWCFTWHGITRDNLNINDEKELRKLFNFKYICVGWEKCPKTDRLHLQGYVEFRSQCFFNTLRKISPCIHWEIRAKGSTARQAADYCKEDGEYAEYGTISQQGKRTDLIKIKDEIISGKTNVDKIVLTEPETYHQYGRTLSKIQSLYQRDIYRSTMTKGLWFWGPTGVGKTHAVYDLCKLTPKEVYLYPNEVSGWCDAYKQQPITLFNDFRGEVSYQVMLNIVDKSPFTLRVRGTEPTPFMSKLVIVTSSLPPHKVFKNRHKEDSLDQLLRRFEVYNFQKEDDKTVGYLNSFKYDSTQDKTLSFVGDKITQEQIKDKILEYAEISEGVKPSNGPVKTKKSKLYPDVHRIYYNIRNFNKFSAFEKLCSDLSENATALNTALGDFSSSEEEDPEIREQVVRQCLVNDYNVMVQYFITEYGLSVDYVKQHFQKEFPTLDTFDDDKCTSIRNSGRYATD